ncbi:ATP-grasp domain-containing protein [Tumebacillus sp. ITR2]|uniref:ATP-grasp domain-containing protein n=1 Tax=Tumebacillus amylolyticus TaxID=2801339 RepID=A0ABS1JC29_9BACL|nr:ATP-grasp domain-containing protein [Tumebacillus amylolyticus]MBL0387835.1 ATP-grasp domain-containing protein [Tumebacillus amylolyticus]
MKAIVFLDSNKSGSSREAIRAADRLGYVTILITDRQSFLTKRQEFPDVHRMIYKNLNDMEDLRKQLRDLQEQGFKIELVVSFVERRVHAAALLNLECTESTQSVEAIPVMENKIKTREALRDTPYGLAFSTLENSEDILSFLTELENQLPLIIKNPNSTGSKDVIKVNNYNQLVRETHRLQKRYPGDPILFEEVVDGPQYLVEALVEDGVVHIAAVIEQDITTGSRFIITGYSVMPTHDAEFAFSLVEAVTDIITTVGLERGPCHLEMRLCEGQWKLIEINPRISGGAMNAMIEAAFGTSLVEETLKLLLGLKIDLSHRIERHIYTHYITVEETGRLERVTGRRKASAMPGVLEVFVKPRKGQMLYEPESMGHRYAYVIATGETAEEAKQNAINAGAHIQFEVYER